MSLRHFLRRFIGDQHGSVAEFALVLPLALMFLLGTIDAGRYLYAVNQQEKATQMGARFAVVTNPVAPELTSTSLVGEVVDSVTLTQGDRIPVGAPDLITCASTGCTDPDPTLFCPCTMDTSSTGPFANILARVKQFKPDAASTNLIIEYRGSGLGYAGVPNGTTDAGDPIGMDVAPLTTVRLSGIQFAPFVLFGSVNFNLPDSSHTLTMEDASGTGSN